MNDPSTVPVWRRRKTFILLIACIAVIAVLAVWLGWPLQREIPKIPDNGEHATPQPSFNGPSENLSETRILPTLKTPWPKGQNAVWCATLAGAWQALAKEVVNAPILLAGAEDLCGQLNAAQDPGSFLGSDEYYSTAGWVSEGVIAKIHRDLRELFPTKEPPRFPGIIPESVLAYSYLIMRIRFPIPYSQNPKPLHFAGGGGRTTPVHSFGLFPGHPSDPQKIRYQMAVLLDTSPEERESHREFAIDLCRSSKPNQVIVARISRQSNLFQTIEYLDMKIRSQSESRSPRKLSSSSILLVPDIFWRISHRFRELERRPFLNDGFDAPTLSTIRQDIEFRLDRSGVLLESEVRLHSLGMPSHYIVDHPFLVLVRK